jgi:hypothetical protein
MAPRALDVGPQAGQIGGRIFLFSVSFTFLEEYGVFEGQNSIRAGSDRHQGSIRPRSGLRLLASCYSGVL